MANGLTSLGCLIMLAPVVLGFVVLLIAVLVSIPYIGWVLAAVVALLAIAAVVGIASGLMEDGEES